MESKEKAFNENRYIAKQVAVYYTRRYHRPFHETLDHAEFALALLVCDAAGAHKPELGTVEAWLRFKIGMHLKDVYLRGYHPHCADVLEPRKQKEMAHSPLLAALDEATELRKAGPPKPNTSWINRLLTEVGEEASALIEIILDAPHDLLNEISSREGRSKEYKRQSLISYLVDILDWSEWEVRQAMVEVETCLNR